MAGRYRNSSENNRSRFYILLSIIFVIVLFKWGVPLFMDLIAGDGVVKLTTDVDTLAPQTPALSALPESTNSSSLTVEGYTEAGAALDLLINDNISVVSKAGDDGFFSVVGELSSGQNRVYVRAADLAGNMSTSEVEMVAFDNKEIELTISSPRDGAEFFGKNSQVIDVVGEVNKLDSQVIVNNSFVVVDRDGKFVHRFQLANGNNELKIVASDKAGNTAERTIKILYTP